jgi:hypothetical protein
MLYAMLRWDRGMHRLLVQDREAASAATQGAKGLIAYARVILARSSSSSSSSNSKKKRSAAAILTRKLTAFHEAANVTTCIVSCELWDMGLFAVDSRRLDAIRRACRRQQP